MHTPLDLRCVVCALVFALACSSTSKQAAHRDAGAAGQPGSSGGAAVGHDAGKSSVDASSGGSLGPAISSAPAAWVRPADCAGVGERCVALGCGGSAICQSLSNACIPALASGAKTLPSKSATHPYCAAYTCMSFDEASCFCTGPAVDTEPSCSSPSALAGLCVGQGQGCTQSACCDGLSCVSDGYTGKVCEVKCSDSTQCKTGCCADLRDTGDKICAPQAACDKPCKKRGETCTQATSSSATDCCRGSCINSPNPEFAGCRPTCTKSTDCDTGCCSLFANSTYGFCADAKYCVCGVPGARCGGNTAQCCAGNECVGQTVDTLSCHQVCTDNSQCPSKCCSVVTGADYKVCEDPSYCP